MAAGLKILPSVLTSSPSNELNQIQSTLAASIATLATLLQSPVHHQKITNQQNAVDRLLLPICNATENPVAQYFALLAAISFWRYDSSEDDSITASAAAGWTNNGNDDRAIRSSMAAFLTKPGNSPTSFPFAACSLLVRRGPMSVAVKPDFWLRRFMETARATSPGRVCFAPEVQGMILFHISVELERILGTGIADDLIRSPPFIQILVEIAESPNNLANKLAIALLGKISSFMSKSINIQRLNNRVPQWTVNEVRRWLLACVGLTLDVEMRNATDFLDGDLLLTMPLQELRQLLFSNQANKTKWAFFQRHLTHLKMMADYSAFDSSDIDGWLTRVDPKLRQYTYAFLQTGIDRHFACKIGKLDENILVNDCGVANGVHRQLILTASKCLAAADPERNRAMKAVHVGSFDHGNVEESNKKWLYDVFICYK